MSVLSIVKVTEIVADYIENILHSYAIRFLVLSRTSKRSIVFILDIFCCMLSVWMAFYLRFGYFEPSINRMVLPALLSVCLALPIFVKFGLYRSIFRYSGMPAMLAVARSMLFYSFTYGFIISFFGAFDVPRTIGFIQPLLLLLLIGASRAVARYWLGGLYHETQMKNSLPQALIYGAGSAGRQLASVLAHSMEIRVVGFLDDDVRLNGHALNGLPIYKHEDLSDIVSRRAITDVLLALPSVSRVRRNEILRTLKKYKLAVRTIPSMHEIAMGRESIAKVRELDIDDLLGRDPVMPDKLLIELNTFDKTVLVTGAGGSIGGELCRQLLKAKPQRILLVESSEFALYQIHQELNAFLSSDDSLELKSTKNESAEFSQYAKVQLIPLLGSVCDQMRMHEIMSTWKPHAVFHAAAYKHVPIVEHNLSEGLRNNVWGTYICAKAAIDNQIANFLLISTDKAVRPTNIMGASKRLAEMILQALAIVHVNTCFSMVRFGNVLGSSGSVVPLFREQIKNGGPITLTHLDMTRYFMTIPEAAQLVIQAGAMANSGDVFVLDMGVPVKIADLAKRMVELSGLSLRDEANPNGDIKIQITGLRPGEKLYEELLISANPIPTKHPRIVKAREELLNWSQLEVRLDELYKAISVNDVLVVRCLLKELVHGYQHEDEVVDWVWAEKNLNSPARYEANVS
jgi:FlaA1/EpsC-like NDP-sugar epimerase